MRSGKNRLLTNQFVWAALLLVVVVLCNAVVAQEKPQDPVQDVAMFERQEVPDPEPRFAKMYAPMVTGVVRARRAARLNQGETNVVLSRAKIPSKHSFTAGNLLVGSGVYTGLYCLPVPLRLFKESAPCLLDDDADGSFESALLAVLHGKKAHGFVFTAQGTLVGMTFGTPVPLASPLRYYAVDSREGPTAKAELVWEARQRKLTAGQSITVSVFLSIDAGTSGTGTTSAKFASTLPEGVGLLTFPGFDVRVVGADPKHGLQYQVEQVPETLPVALRFTPTREVITIPF